MRAVQDQRFRRVGGNTEVTVDVRVISASNLNLQKEIENGNLREDLFYRLSVVPIEIPSLSQRREDIPDLAQHFLKSMNNGQGKAKTLSADALAMMQVYAWPGNVTQLRNMIDWLLIMCDKEVITDADLPPEISGKSTDQATSDFDNVVGLPLKAARERFETQYLLSQRSRFNGNISKTASFIGMERSALHRKMKSLDINPDHGDNLEDDE